MFRKNINITKRVSAFLLALLMLLGALPLNVFAEALEGKANYPIVIDSNTINEEEPSAEPKGADPVKYTISFNSNGGTGDMESVEVAEGEEYSLPKNEFEAPEGKEFKSWLMGEDELKKDHKLVVEKDIELKANWEDIKVNPVKKALDSFLGKDKEELELGNVDIGEAVMAGENTTEGDPQGTVVSKDGKTRITMFEVNWVGTNEKTVVNDVDRYTYSNNSKNSFQAEAKWAISGEREYKPGTVRINMTNKVFIGEAQKYNFSPDFKNMPVPKAVLKEDGSIDFNADYKKSDFVYVENDDNTISLVNIITLQPGNHENYTITYKAPDWNPNIIKDEHYFDSGDISSPLKSSITVITESDETIKKEAADLYIKSTKTPKVYVGKNVKRYDSWPLSEDTAPENKEDYMYLVYGITVSPKGYFFFDLDIEDQIEDKQTLVGYSLIKHEDVEEDISLGKWYNYRSFYLNNNKKIKEPEIFELINHQKELISTKFKTLNTNTMKLKVDDCGISQHYKSDIPDSNIKLFVITKVPKSVALNGQTQKWENSIKVTAHTKEKTPQVVHDEDSISLNYKYSEFQAPGNSFSTYKTHDSTKELGAIEILLNNGRYDLVKPFRVESAAEAVGLTYDPNFGEKNNQDAYGRKTFKLITADDYLFFENEPEIPLTNEDIEIKSFKINSFDVGIYGIDSTGKASWTKTNLKNMPEELKKGKILKSTVYGKKSHNGDWIKLADFSDYGYTKLYNGTKYYEYNQQLILPEGFIRIKMESETNYHYLKSLIYLKHTVKPSERVKSYLQNQIDNNKEVRLYNFSTTAVYDNDGNLVGYKPEQQSSSQVNPFKETTSKLDKEEYGEEMAHYNTKVALLGAKKTFRLEKGSYELKNDEKEKQFSMKWVVSAREDVVGAKVEDMNELASGIFYDLIPKGLVLDESSIKVVSYKITHESGYDRSLLPIKYKIINNYKNSGRDLLVVSYKGYLDKNEVKDFKKNDIQVSLSYYTTYPWDSYKDYGSDFKNIVAFEPNADKIKIYSPYDRDIDGYKDEPKEFSEFSNEEKEIMKDLNPDHDNPVFIYAMRPVKVQGNTIANTGLTKHIRGPQDIRYTTKTKVKEGDSYSYKLRLASQLGTSTSNIILYDTLEDYTLLKSDEDYGINTWKGSLESIDISQPLNKGIDAVVYYSTVPNLKIRKPDPKSSIPVDQQENTVDLTDTSIWTKEKPADLSKVTAIAVDLTKDKNGQPYVLKENESVVVNLHMKAPWNMKEHNIDITDKAINEIYANTTVTTNLDSKSENELINTAYTAVNLEPVVAEAPIKAIKKHLDKEGKDVALKGDDFTFELKDSEGKVLQTKTNDAKGDITFDPIKYNSWDVGEHTYKIVEVKGDSETTAYDSHEEIVKVNVEREGNSNLEATITYDEDGATFTNHEVDPIITSLEAKKVYIGKGGLEEKPTAGAFEFILKDAEGTEVAKATNNAEGKVVFEGLEFKPNEIGEHKYTIEEVKGNNPAIEYDSAKKNITINVSLTEDFKLKVDVVYEGEEIPTFTNTLKSASLQLVKLKGGSDTFILDEVKDENGFLTSYKVPEAQKDNVLNGAEYELYKIEANGTETLIDTLITKNGISQVVQDIMPGKYKLKETKAPKGYTLNDKDLIFDITDKEAGTIVTKFVTDDGIIDMPSTGGQGTKALMVGGGILVTIMAGVLVVANKKKKEQLNK